MLAPCAANRPDFFPRICFPDFFPDFLPDFFARFYSRFLFLDLFMDFSSIFFPYLYSIFYKTSGAKDIIFMNIDLNSLVTGPNILVPIG